MSNPRERNAQHKIHIPVSARESQYLLAKINIDDALLIKYAHLINPQSEQPYQAFYQHLASIFFNISASLAIESCQFIANDKFTRVRFSAEKFTFETEQQIVFLYNPHYHHSDNSYLDGSKLVKKISLVFLANGIDIRGNAAKFHRKVSQAIKSFITEINLQPAQVRLSDHQHLAYDLFAKEKGITVGQAHKLRTIANRYLADGVMLPDNHDSLTYVIADLPINRRIKQLFVNEQQDYEALYSFISNAFIAAAKDANIQNGAIVANGLIPIVRRSKGDEFIKVDGELLMIGYNPRHTQYGFTSRWSPEHLVDTIQLVYLASDLNRTSHGFGKFLGQVEQALRTLAEQLDYLDNKEELLIRFHQHTGYYLS